MNETRLRPTSLEAFVSESNRIEGLTHDPLPREIAAHENFLALDRVLVLDLCAFVAAVAPSHRLRSKEGLDVRVGDHVAPRGGPTIPYKLDAILADATRRTHADFFPNPHAIHLRYEHLHPFTDGNGRSGRVLWLWCMKRAGRLDEALDLGFLRLWYYESLRAYDASKR